MNIIKKTSTANTTGLKNRKIKYIVEHYTAGVTSKQGSAKNTAAYFSNPSVNASADFIVDDVDIVQYNPDPANRYCWSVGGKKYNNKGGRLYKTVTSANSISIQICSTNKTRKVTAANDSNWYFTDAVVDRAVELTKYLMQKYNIDANHVIRHYDVNGKPCPGIYGWNAETGNESKWKNFLSRINDGKPVSVTYTTENLRNGDRGDAVKTMQTMLNTIGYSCGNADGIFGKNTETALIQFQKDHNLDADGIYGKKSKAVLESAYQTPTPTEAKSAQGLQATALKNLSESELIKTVGPLFTKDQQNTGILACVSLAQFILESGWGKSGLTQSANNGFGMKTNLSSNNWSGSVWDGSVYKTQTKEQKTNGTIYTITAEFRKYPSLDASIADHSAYLNGAKKGTALRYAGLKGCTDYRKAAQIIKDGGYATSLSYVSSLCSLIQRWNLTQYNVNSTAQTQPTTSSTATLKKGSKGEQVKTLQTMLIGCNYDCGKTGTDGDFGKSTESALKQFQKEHHLTIDGIYGKNSKAKLQEIYHILCIQSFDENIVKAYHTTARLNLREGTGKNYSVITIIPKGDKVICYGYHTDDWYCVRYKDYTGFCNKNYLR